MGWLEATFFVEGCSLKELVGVFGFGLDDVDFNFVIGGEEVGDVLAFGHVVDTLFDC